MRQVAFALWVLAGGACAGGTPRLDPSGFGGAGGASSAGPCARPGAGPATLRRLDAKQYEASVRDLLGDAAWPGVELSADDPGAGVSWQLAEDYVLAAEAIAARAVTDLPRLLPCDPAPEPRACARRFFDVLAARAYRRPVAAGEIDELMAVYDDGAASGTANDGFRLAIAAVLAAPDFLYLVERNPAGAPGEVVSLGPYELAARLSYLVRGGPPDAELLRAAAAGELGTPAQLAAQAERLLAEPRARERLREFVERWIRLDRMAEVAKDTSVYKEWGEELRASMIGETRAFVDWALNVADGTLATLLGAPVTFVDGRGARIYDVARGGGVARLDLDPAQRAGLLTQPALMAILSGPASSSPVARGAFVREVLLCQTLPDPPGDAPPAPDPAPGLTTRERFAVHTEDQRCAGCHALIDPIGFGFESLDGVGRYRATEEGVTVDDRGELTGAGDADGAFEGAAELGRRLGASAVARGCVAAQWFRFALGRREGEADRCSLAAVERAFAARDFDLRALPGAIAASDGFRHLVAEPPEVGP